MTSVMIVHEIDLLRGALAAVLSHEADFDVTAQASPADDVTAAALAARPDVIVFHLQRCDLAALDLPRRLRAEVPGAAVVLVAEEYQPEALRAVLDADVRGFLDADAAPASLIEAVRGVAAGERMIDPLLLVAALRDDDNPLTPRQREVLRLAAEGLSARDIGRRLYLSSGTVRNYLSAAIRQAGGRSLLEAITHAREEGWL
jgi:two-component system response regulator DesR